MTTSPNHEKRLNIVQGEFAVSQDENVVITTLLGSCVAVSMHDPVVRVGGLNHFLLPGSFDGRDGDASGRLGVHLMELLINGLLKLGASRDRLQAKLFGGAKTVRGLSDIGSLNVRFGQDFLHREGIQLLPGSTGGEVGRRLQFWPASGRVRQAFMAHVDDAVISRPAVAARSAGSGDLELF